ncbi:hypothetical protein GCM10010909_10720 [Acidocella aquatica]|uniref:Uncharacterized protein n=1 Tax=Acidocella aquatica TaxID=1922313 RepID=A0ABQ6A406_9PROT|nr:hypothetical protein [Acidocella aquatica]GLR66392.1 hypothetical protein GCM10010909_10720 [Acidocella aquatica]
MDLNQNAIDGDAVNEMAPSGGDDPLLEACEEFFSAFDAWKCLMREWDHAGVRPARFKRNDALRTRQRWQQALAHVRSVPAQNRNGLEAKRLVLGAVSYFGEMGDPSFTDFAVELVDEYQNYLLENDRPASGSPSNGSPIKAGRRLNLTNIFGFLNH